MRFSLLRKPTNRARRFGTRRPALESLETRQLMDGYGVFGTLLENNSDPGNFEQAFKVTQSEYDNASVDKVSIVYDAGTGELAVDAPNGVDLTSINIVSASEIFTTGPAENLDGPFDIDNNGTLFKVTFGGSFSRISFGEVAQPRLSKEFIVKDLSVIGSIAGSRDGLGEVDIVHLNGSSSNTSPSRTSDDADVDSACESKQGLTLLREPKIEVRPTGYAYLVNETCIPEFREYYLGYDFDGQESGDSFGSDEASPLDTDTGQEQGDREAGAPSDSPKDTEPKEELDHSGANQSVIAPSTKCRLSTMRARAN